MNQINQSFAYILWQWHWQTLFETASVLFLFFVSGNANDLTTIHVNFRQNAHNKISWAIGHRWCSANWWESVIACFFQRSGSVDQRRRASYFAPQYQQTKYGDSFQAFMGGLTRLSDNSVSTWTKADSNVLQVEDYDRLSILTSVIIMMMVHPPPHGVEGLGPR